MRFLITKKKFKKGKVMTTKNKIVEKQQSCKCSLKKFSKSNRLVISINLITAFGDRSTLCNFYRSGGYDYDDVGGSGDHRPQENKKRDNVKVNKKG